MMKKYDFIIDSHCHLDLVEEKGLDIDSVVRDAAENGVKFLQTISTKVTEFGKIKSFIDKYPNVFCSIGVHPNNVDSQPSVSSQDLISICNENSKVIGIGETGLDYHYQYSKRDNQINSFIAHIEASRATGLPIIIHNRESDEDMMQILGVEMKKKPFNILLHCFSSSRSLALKVVELGGYVSISGIVTFKNAIDIQNTVKDLPLDRILVETDSPYLAPVPYRGRVNQPAYTRNTVEFIANIKNVDNAEIISETTSNFFKLFSANRAIQKLSG